MSILENYLDELFGSKYIDADDPSLPNPYNFRQLKLDPKITTTDIRKANIEWKKSYDKDWVNEPSLGKVIRENPKNKWKNGKYYVIVDKGQRVGIVGAGHILLKSKDISGLLWVTWVKGKNYATAGIMKFLNLSRFPQNKKFEITFHMKSNNIASVKVGENLKATKEISTYRKETDFTLHPPYWWNNKKFLKH